MPKVSVVIPCYNLGKFVGEAVESVVSQTYTDFEIIVVNDGSTDGLTNRLLAEATWPHTTIITTENRGPASARNTGIRVGSGDYVCCLDADDTYHPQFLEKTVPVLDGDSTGKIGIVSIWVQVFGMVDRLWQTEDYDPFKLAVENLVPTASLFRRTCWEEAGGYSDDIFGYEDWDFWLSVVSKGYRWECVKEPLFNYRVREHSRVKEGDQGRLKIYGDIVRKNIDYYASNCVEIIHCFIASVERLRWEAATAYSGRDDILRQYQELDGRYHQIRRWYDDLETKYKELQESLSQKEAQWKISEQRRMQQEEEIDRMVSSWSWKITSPLRRFIGTWADAFRQRK